MRTVVVTGASSGIGLALSEGLTNAGYRVFGSVRSGADLLRLKQSLGERFYPLIMDVTARDSVRRAAGSVRNELSRRLFTDSSTTPASS